MIDSYSDSSLVWLLARNDETRLEFARSLNIHDALVVLERITDEVRRAKRKQIPGA